MTDDASEQNESTHDTTLYSIVSDILKEGALSATATIVTNTNAQVVVTVNVVTITNPDGEVLYNIHIPDLLNVEATDR